MSDTKAAGPAGTTPRFGKPRSKVPPFARYEGTSAWRKDRTRVREYARFRASMNRTDQTPATPKL